MKHLIAAVALSSLAGCAGYFSAQYHAISEHPPTPTAREAFDVCNRAAWNSSLVEDTVNTAVMGPLAAPFVTADRKAATMLSCMREHGYERS